MKVSLISFAIAAATCLSVFTTGGNAACPNGVQTRREIRTLSPAERERFWNAVRTIRNNGQLEKLAQIHYESSDVIHFNSIFLPWHRAITQRFQELIATAGGGTIPYWQWGWDYQNPSQSAIFKDWMAGGNGNGGCVRDGPMAGMSYRYPSTHCLVRRFVNGDSLPPLPSDTVVASTIYQMRDYPSFNHAIEYDIHPFVHNNIGGDISTMYSPNDPIFFLHHANIDRHYYMWQAQDWSRRATAYGGNNRNGSPARLTDSLPGLGGTVGDYIDPRDPLCYTYDDLGGAHLNAMSAVFNALPSDTVKKFFGGMLSDPQAQKMMRHAHANAEQDPEAAAAAVAAALEGIVAPPPLDPTWMKMMGMDVTRANRGQEMFTELVAALKNITKRS
ncbi:Di-copper centre-containing protein [Ramicandelaber brevisporus]|nr:Di-copper centre-containing protein [Ramicandelaber brevisporus]